MLKAIPGCESLRHICDRWSPENQALNIFLHDVQPHAVIAATGAWAGNIKHCPYCGVEIEKEARP